MKKEYKIFDDDTIELLRSDVIKKFDNILKTNTHCKLLVDDIFENTGRSVGNTTIRRFFGLDRSANKPSIYTLDTLSLYAGYDSFEHFIFQKKENRKTGKSKKNKSLQRYNWQEFKAISDEFSYLNYKIVKNKLKLPYDIVIERQNTSDFISNFFESDKMVTAIVSPPDCGKSIAVAKFIEKRWFNYNPTNDVLIYFGPHSFTQLVNKSFDFQSWFSNTFKNYDYIEFLNFFELNVEKREGNCVIIFDSIETIANNSKLFDLFINAFIKYISTIEHIKWIKIIFLSRTATWNNIISTISKFQALERFFYNLPFKTTNDSLINFELLNKDEIESIIKLALNKYFINDYTLVRPILSTNICQLLRYPFFLELYINNYLNNKESSLSEVGIISSFIDDRITNTELNEEKQFVIDIFLKSTNYGLDSYNISKNKLVSFFQHKNSINALRELLNQGVFKEKLIFNKLGALSNYIEMRNYQIFLFFVVNHIANQYKNIKIRTFLYVLSTYNENEKLKYDIICWLIKICFFRKDYELILNLRSILIKIKTIEVGNKFIEGSGLEKILLTIKNELCINPKARQCLLPKMAKYAEWQKFFFEYCDDLDFINIFYGDSLLNYLLYKSTDKGMMFAHSILLTKNVLTLNYSNAKFHYDTLNKLNIDLNQAHPKLLGKTIAAKVYFLLAFEHNVPLSFWDKSLEFERKFIYSNAYKNYYQQFYIELMPATSLAQRYDLTIYFWGKIFPHYDKLLEQVWGSDYERGKIFVANAYLELGQYQNGINIFNSIHLDKINNFRAISNSLYYITLSKFLLIDKKFTLALETLDKSIFISKSYNLPFLEQFAEVQKKKIVEASNN